MRKEILLGILLAILLAYIFFVGVPVVRLESEKRVIEMKASEEDLTENEFYREVEISLPAVEEGGEGIMALLKVEVHEGDGRTLLEIADISFLDDTQESIRIAKLVAEKITNVDTSIYDIVYSVNANASKIEGPSAGPAMAVATSIALQNKKLNNSIVISGFLREDGTIGKVSGILPKAEVAKQNEVKLFLVPLGQRIQTKTETKKNCEHDILTTFCETETIEKKVDIQEEVGIDVIEVGNVEEALEYFIVD